MALCECGARELVEYHSSDEPEWLCSDFFNSLLAAYEEHEIRDPLARTGFGEVGFEVALDRHFIVWGAIAWPQWQRHRC